MKMNGIAVASGLTLVMLCGIAFATKDRCISPGCYNKTTYDNEYCYECALKNREAEKEEDDYYNYDYDVDWSETANSHGNQSGTSSDQSGNSDSDYHGQINGKKTDSYQVPDTYRTYEYSSADDFADEWEDDFDDYDDAYDYWEDEYDD